MVLMLSPIPSQEHLTYGGRTSGACCASETLFVSRNQVQALECLINPPVAETGEVVAGSATGS